jgi:hypothetical protein
MVKYILLELVVAQQAKWRSFYEIWFHYRIQTSPQIDVIPLLRRTQFIDSQIIFILKFILLFKPKFPKLPLSFRYFYHKSVTKESMTTVKNFRDNKFKIVTLCII